MTTKDLPVSRSRKRVNAKFESWRQQMTARELAKERPRRAARGHVATICREAVVASRQASQRYTRLSREGNEVRVMDVQSQVPIGSTRTCRQSIGMRDQPLRKRPMSAGAVPIRTHSQRRPLSAGATPVRVPPESRLQRRPLSAGATPVRVPPESWLQISENNDPSCSGPCITREMPDYMQKFEDGRCASIKNESSIRIEGPGGAVACEFGSVLQLDDQETLLGDVLYRALDDAKSPDSNSVRSRPRPASAPSTRTRPPLLKPKFPSQQSEAVQALLRGEINLQTVPDNAAYIYMETENRRAFAPREESVPAMRVRSDRNLPTAPV